jgi:hypothetical protein
MTAAHTQFYLELLESRLRFLDRQIAKAGRLDPAFVQLSAEREAVTLELEGLLDDVGRRAEHD